VSLQAPPKKKQNYFFAGSASTGTLGPGTECACSLELDKAGDSASFGCPPGYPDGDTPVRVCAKLPPSGPVVLVPQPDNIPATTISAQTPVRRNIFLIIN
jgi:hypothetical protein